MGKHSKIYIVGRASGDYDDFRTRNVRAFTSEKAAEEFRALCTAEVERIEEHKKKAEERLRNRLERMRARGENTDEIEDWVSPDEHRWGRNCVDPTFKDYGYDLDSTYYVEPLEVICSPKDDPAIITIEEAP